MYKKKDLDFLKEKNFNQIGQGIYFCFQVVSRIIFQMFGIMLMVFVVFGKFISVFIIIFYLVVGGLQVIGFGIFFGFVFGNLQYIDMNFIRNFVIIGLLILWGFIIFYWLKLNGDDVIQIGKFLYLF